MTDMKISETNDELKLRAHAVLPGGHFGNMASDIVIAKGKEARIWDNHGNEYVDFLLGSGPMFVGHAHPKVTEAVLNQVPNGTTFFANNEHGIKLAEEICAAVDCVDQVRFVSSGSEATLYAMRIARAYRGRDKILKFEGGYHGMSDYSLMSLAPKTLSNFPQAIPDSPGIPEKVSEEVIIAPFNDVEMFKSIVSEHHDQLGAVIVEPFQRLIPPAPGFLELLREITLQYDIPLIFDEIVTGFRFSYGGAQEFYSVTPDLCSLGKIIGGGFPLPAVGGRADLMQLFDKDAVGEKHFLPQIGTLSGNPVASAAGLATLEILKSRTAYETVFDTGRTLMAELEAAMKDFGHSATVIGEPPLFDVFFTDDEITDYRGILKADSKKGSAFNQLLRSNQVFKGDSKFYVSLAHTNEDTDLTVNAIREAARALKDL
ncbi:MAG: aminotransferase class III-fold pyridoxal phosphate-dependent enzyme [Pseudomonadota bacterium]|nr:aminotransferase class III-fold pyridoxal phosphate-dependent enzyme [Pseudomonadota bacterium]